MFNVEGVGSGVVRLDCISFEVLYEGQMLRQWLFITGVFKVVQENKLHMLMINKQ
jgi:hypothetical protein